MALQAPAKHQHISAATVPGHICLSGSKGDAGLHTLTPTSVSHTSCDGGRLGLQTNITPGRIVVWRLSAVCISLCCAPGYLQRQAVNSCGKLGFYAERLSAPLLSLVDTAAGHQPLVGQALSSCYGLHKSIQKQIDGLTSISCYHVLAFSPYCAVGHVHPLLTCNWAITHADDV